jgi:beta-N-acetylglucosaminidase
MKQLSKLLLSILMIFTIISVYTPEIVNATNNYSMLCPSQYELSTANADGSFTKKACYDDFYAARDAMSDVNDVVRHDSSLSPMKIIAMKQGVGYTYPARDSRITSSFYQYYTTSAGYSGKSTSSTVYREFIYYSTDQYYDNGKGIIFTNLNGFEGYTELMNVDLIPQIFIDNNIEVSLGSGYSAIANRSYYTAKQNGNYTDLVFTWFSGKPASDTNTMFSYSHNIGQAPDWMEIGEIYYSDNGYDFYTNTSFTDKVETYYPYYVYLPFRSSTDIPAFVFDNYLINKIDGNESVMKDKGQVFIDNQNEYGVNALMTFALGSLESGFGTSSISTSKNNLFGWNAVDTSPGESANYYETVDLCIRDHMAINLRGYLDAFDYRYFGSHIGNKGSGFNVKYATDTYWGYKIAAIAYEIDKLSHNNDGTLTDYDKYDLYNAPVFGSKLYKTDSKETKLYSLDYGGIYQEANIQIATGSTSNSTKVQSTNIIDTNGDVVKHNSSSTPITSYDWNRSIGYMKPSELIQINNFVDNSNEGLVAVGDFYMDISEFSLNNNVVSISGKAYQPGIYIDDVDSLQHYLYITNSSGEEVKSIVLIQTNSGIEHYQASNFIAFNLDISDLITDETYNFSIKTVGDKYTEIANITSVSETSYTIDSDDYILTSTTEETLLTIEDNTPEVTPTPTETPDTGVVEVKYYTWLDGYTLNEEGILSFNGYAFVTGKDNGEGNIEHKIEIVNLSDYSIVDTLNLNTITGEQDISDWFVDDFDYSYAYFSGSLDISGYDISEYKFRLITNVENVDYTQDIRVQNDTVDSDVVEVNEKQYQLTKEYYYKYRLELNISKVALEIDKKVLPTRMESSIYISGIEYNETNNSIRIAGDAFAWKADFDVNKNPKYEVYLINTVTGDVFVESSDGLDSLEGMYYEDLSSIINNKFDTDYSYTNIWFDTTFNISDLPEGSYVGVVKIMTDNITDFVDLKTNASISMLDFSSTELDLSSEINSNNKNRIKFIITKK